MDVKIYIPGHGLREQGDVPTQELLRLSRALEAVIAEATRLHKAGVLVDDAIAGN